MLLTLSTWPDIEAWLTHSKAVLIPIGSQEQHGPNGFIGTDALCPEIIAHEAEKAARDTLLVTPTFNTGSSQHHLGFPGTITYRPSTMIAAMTDWVESLMRHGFERFYFLNGHGGNIAPIQTAFAEIHARRSFDVRGGDNRPGLTFKLRNWWELEGVASLSAQLYPVGEGMHATASEVSVTYFGYPEQERQRTPMSPKIAPDGSIGDAVQYRRDFPDGRIGSDPSQSNAADGAKIVARAKQSLLAEWRVF